MIAFLATTVHTTGVNFQGVLANVASITVILGAFLAVVTRSIKRSVRDQISEVVHKEVMPVLEQIKAELRDHDTRIARMEGIEEGKKMANAAAAVTIK